MKLFVHIPKNGGSSVRELIRRLRRKDVVCAPVGVRQDVRDGAVVVMDQLRINYGTHHARWRDFNDDMRQHQAFAIIRNPWSRAVSQFEYSKRIAAELKNIQYGEIEQHQTFDRFLDTRFLYDNREYFWLRPTMSWFQQKDYITDHCGQLQCDVLRLESDDVNRYLDVELFPRHNVGNTVDYRKYYTAASYDVIANWYADDIETFGFTFDGTATTNIWNHD